jgi:hypothetical protein
MNKSNSSTITTKDGTEIYYKDWGKGPVVTFSHGWPLSSSCTTASAWSRTTVADMAGLARSLRGMTWMAMLMILQP